MDPSWINTSLVDEFTPLMPGPVVALNDADAAGLAEVRYGAGKGQRGVVLMVTLGTGIGTALIHNGVLVPNAELGHIELDGHDAETRAAASARERHDLSWKEWAKRVSSTCGTWRTCSGPTCSSSAAGSRRSRTPGSARSPRSVPRW